MSVPAAAAPSSRPPVTLPSAIRAYTRPAPSAPHDPARRRPNTASTPRSPAISRRAAALRTPPSLPSADSPAIRSVRSFACSLLFRRNHPIGLPQQRFQIGQPPPAVPAIHRPEPLRPPGADTRQFRREPLVLPDCRERPPMSVVCPNQIQRQFAVTPRLCHRREFMPCAFRIAMIAPPSPVPLGDTAVSGIPQHQLEAVILLTHVVQRGRPLHRRTRVSVQPACLQEPSGPLRHPAHMLIEPDLTFQAFTQR